MKDCYTTNGLTTPEEITKSHTGACVQPFTSLNFSTKTAYDTGCILAEAKHYDGDTVENILWAVGLVALVACISGLYWYCDYTDRMAAIEEAKKMNGDPDEKKEDEKKEGEEETPKAAAPAQGEEFYQSDDHYTAFIDREMA